MHLAYTQHCSVPESFIFTMYECYYGKSSIFLKEIKLETQTVLFAHQTFGFFMKTIRESIDFTSFYMTTG